MALEAPNNSSLALIGRVTEEMKSESGTKGNGPKMK